MRTNLFAGYYRFDDVGQTYLFNDCIEALLFCAADLKDKEELAADLNFDAN